MRSIHTIAQAREGEEPERGAGLIGGIATSVSGYIHVNSGSQTIFPCGTGFGAASNDFLETMASAYDRELATVEFLTDECVIPQRVDIDEVFDIKIVYELTVQKRDYDGMLQHFPFVWDGGFYYKPLGFCICFWVWYLLNWYLEVRQGVKSPKYVVAKTHSHSDAGQKLTWQFHGTISQLLGETVQPGASVTVGWRISGRNIGYCTPQDMWPYEWNLLEDYKFDGPCNESIGFTTTIQVNATPTPPNPVFKPDECSASKQSVYPNESFNIKATIENKNQYSGNYTIDCYCEGNKTTLATGTISGYQTVSKTVSVTAAQLADKEFTQSQYIDITLAVSNSQGETDRVGPAEVKSFEIAVIVTGEEEVGNLSGKVTDKKTGDALSGVTVSTAGRRTTTNSLGKYSFSNLTVGSYTVKFSKTGYWEETKSVTIKVGENTLNVAMTPTSEAPPTAPGEIPWTWLGIGAVAIMALALILPKKEKVTK
jgi:hypothetical protein